MASHGLDLLRHGRSMRLVNGNALAGRLGKSLFELGIPLWLSSPATGLIRDGNRVVGVKLVREGRAIELRSRRGVVLASGGFPHDQHRRKRLYRHDPKGRSHWPLPPKGNTGDGASMAESIGARFSMLFHRQQHGRLYPKCDGRTVKPACIRILSTEASPALLP